MNTITLILWTVFVYFLGAVSVIVLVISKGGKGRK